MIEYRDDNHKELKEGFYITKRGDIKYFTGNYNKNGEPLFEHPQIKGKTISEYNYEIFRDCEFNSITEEEVKKKLKNLKEKTNWLEKKLKEQK